MTMTMFGSFPRALSREPWFGLTSTKPTQVEGADMVMKSTIGARHTI